jgi:L-fuconolactonase
MIDSHLHIWELTRFAYTWITPELAVLNRDYSIQTALKVLQANQINHAILVEASNSLPETNWLLKVANANPEILGVIGWCDLTSSTLKQDLEPMLQHQKFIGVRPALPACTAPDSRWEAMHNGIEFLATHNLSCDLLIPDRMSLRLCQLVSAHPRVTFVLNHFAGADFTLEHHASWAASLQCFAKLNHVNLKISGFLTAAKHKPLTQENFDLYYNTALEYFGTDRLIYGSDYPVCTLAGQYKDTLRLLENTDSKVLFAENTRQIYRLEDCWY